jgi:hypothetical protein
MVKRSIRSGKRQKNIAVLREKIYNSHELERITRINRRIQGGFVEEPVSVMDPVSFVSTREQPYSFNSR